MYGLKQSGLLTNQLLQTRLEPFGYYPAQHTPGLWLHKTRPISFTLVVDDFAVKYVVKHHAEHLWNALLRAYELTTDWTAKVYSGMTFRITTNAHATFPCLDTFDKLLPLPQHPVRAHTDARTNPSAERATQLRRVLAHVYAVSIQNQITNTVP
jgi:hypothetical protein